MQASIFDMEDFDRLEYVAKFPLAKGEVLEAVIRELNLTSPPKPDDAADALAIALTGWYKESSTI